MPPPARRIFDYVLRDMTDAAGGFYSAEDADSVIDPEEPHEKGEGAFYIWGADEIRALVPGPAGELVQLSLRRGDTGNVAHDPHSEFTNRNILYQAATLEETAQQFDVPVEEVRAGIEQAERILLDARSTRIRPHLDDKILTSWNGLMIGAFALGGAVLNEPRYAEAARRAAEFILANMYYPATGVLLRRYRQGEAAIPGFLDDYASFVQALLTLYETQFDLRHLELAIRLAEKQAELFEDRERGGFYSSPEGDASLVLRMKEDYDGAEPSGNSLALMNLLRLSLITNRDDFRLSAARTLAAFAPRLSAGPVTLPQMLAAVEFQWGGRAKSCWWGRRTRPIRKCCWERYGRASCRIEWCCWSIRRSRARCSRRASSRWNRWAKSRDVPRRTSVKTMRASFPFPRLRSSLSCYNSPSNHKRRRRSWHDRQHSEAIPLR